MKGVKNIFVITLVLCFALCLSLTVAGCDNKLINKETPTMNGIEMDFSVNYSSRKLSLFDTVQLKIKNYTDVVWESDNTSVVTVSSNGLVTANGFGKANVKGTRGENSAVCVITVEDEGIIPTIELNVAEDNLSLIKSDGISDSFKLNCSITYNGKTYTDGEFTYTTSSNGIVEISKDGLISAVDYGSVQVDIQGSWRNFNQDYLKKSITVNVFHNVSMQLSLENDTVYTVEEIIDDVNYSNVTFLNKKIIVDGQDVTNSQDVIFEIADNSILDLDDNGKITAIKFGKTTITAILTLNGVEYYSLPLTVEIMRPVRKVEKLFVSQKENAFKLEVVGEVLSYTIDEESFVDKAQVTSNGVSISKENLLDVKGKKSICIETDIYVYVYDTIFATHSISTLEELKEYISGITTADSADDYAVLTEDIDCKGYKFKSSGNVQWYKGHFNGLGHAIKNYDADSRGLFGCRLVGGPTVENLALFFNAGSLSSVALAEKAWNVDEDKVYLNNMFIKVTSAMQINSLFTGGTEGQCYQMKNVIIDVSGATVEYAIDDSNRGTASVEQVYAIGKPLSGKIMETRGETVEYLGTLCESTLAFMNEQKDNITSKNGFNEYWSVTDDGRIYFGANVAIEIAEVKEALYKDADFEINAADLLGEEVKKVTVNGEEKTLIDGKLVISIADYHLKVNNEVRIVGATKVIVQPFVKATAVIDSGKELNDILSQYKTNATGHYIVLGNDINLSDAGNSTWAATSSWKFTNAHFDGLGHTIDCLGVTIGSAGIFGDARKTVFENFAIINAKATSGSPILTLYGFGDTSSRTTARNIYVECDYNGGVGEGLFSNDYDAAVAYSCVVRLTNVSADSFAFSDGCTWTTNCYAISNLTKATDISNDPTKIYATDSALYAEAKNNFSFDKGYNSYWQIKDDGIYFGNTLVIKI